MTPQELAHWLTVFDYAALACWAGLIVYVACDQADKAARRRAAARAAAAKRHPGHYGTRED